MSYQDETALHTVRLPRVLVGRDQCRLVRQVLDGRQPGRSNAALILGEEGAGKTTLLEQIAATAPGHPLWVRGVESEAALPYAVIADLLGPLRGFFDLIPRAQREALEANLALRSDAMSNPLYACTGTLTVLAAASAHQRLLIVVDDLQWVDPESRRVLLFVARRLAGERVGMVLAARDQPGSPALPCTELYTVRLTGMSVEQARELVASLGVEVSGAVLEAIVDQTGGNPQAVIETVRSASARAQRLLAAAADAHLAGASGVAQQCCDQALALRSDPCFAAEVILVRARAHIWLGHPLRAADDLVRAADAVLTRDPAWAARLYAEAALPLALVGRFDDMLAITSRSEAVSVRLPGGKWLLGSGVMRAVALAMVGRSADARQLLDDATDSTAGTGPAGDLPQPVDLQHMIILGLGRVWTEDFRGAHPVFGSVLDAASRDRTPAIVPLALAARADLEWWTGHWSPAYTGGMEALQHAEAMGQTLWVGYALVLLGRLHAARGDGALAEHHIHRARRQVGSYGMDFLSVAGPSVLGLSALAAADHSAAADHLDQAWRAARERGLGGTNVVPFGGDLVEAHVRAGNSRRAQDALAWLDERAAATGLAYPAAAAARCHGLLADDLDSARECFARAASLHLRVEMPFERARTLLCEGETLRRLRRPVAARPPLLEALAMFESLGARPWAVRAEIELAATGVRARTDPDVARGGLDVLTPQEFQVAQSVAEGRNNVEVASSLFVSRKTVEAHLTRIYRKLGVRSRTELVWRLVPARTGAVDHTV